MDITKITSVIAVILLVLNLVLASMRIYSFGVFWMVIIAVCAVVYPFNYLIRKKYINGKNIKKNKK
jgi:O-antigen/teichoic acid export membrane protein